MKQITLLPADTYTIVNKTILTDVDKKTLVNLYQPIIGSLSISLYLSLWNDLDHNKIMSIDFTHHHLMTILKDSLNDIKTAREALEGIGLLKTYFKEGEINSYVYELYSPMSASEFFTHPIFNIVLYNNLGKKEYDMIKKQYEAVNYNLNDYVNITKTIDYSFNSTPANIINKENIKESKINKIDIKDGLDFDLIESSLPKGIINSKTFNKRIKELINNLAFIYNLDNLKMIELIRTAINQNGMIEKDELRKRARDYYQYENNSLPTLVFRTQPEYLKSPSGDTSNRGKILYVFENTSCYDFLCHKNHGSNPSLREKKLLENLVIDMGLKPAVVNVLIDYVLRINNNKLNSAYVETIAGQWKRSKIETASDAMKLAEEEHQKYKKKVVVNKKAKDPVWFNERIEKEEINDEEQKELEDLLKEFK